MKKYRAFNPNLGRSGISMYLIKNHFVRMMILNKVIVLHINNNTFKSLSIPNYYRICYYEKV